MGSLMQRLLENCGPATFIGSFMTGELRIAMKGFVGIFIGSFIMTTQGSFITKQEDSTDAIARASRAC